MQSQAGQFWIALGVALIGAAIVGGIGGLVTDIGPWYRALAKPSWQPPDWLFGPVWTTLFVLIAVSAAYGWQSAEDAGRRALIAVLFVINGVLNVIWSFLFFAQKRPDIALIEIAALWLSIVVLMAVLWPRTRIGALLLAPYLAWVSFATLLNGTIVRLN